MATPVRVAFCGSPEFAVPSLEAAIADFDVRLVVTQPDRPAGRSRRPEATPVRRRALEHGVDVVTYVKGERAALEARLRALEIDVLVVVAFGHILRRSTLDAVPRGAVNVHASLLPRWRGAAPIERALLAGDDETGITLMVLDEGVDTGPTLGQERIAIVPADTRLTLTARLAATGAALLRAHLEGWVRGTCRATPQPAEGATYAPRLEKHEGALDWTRDARVLDRQVRGLYEWPGAFTHVGGTLLKVHAVRPLLESTGALPGTLVVADARQGVVVACGGGALALDVVQLPGKPRVAAAALVAGRVLTAGMQLQTNEAGDGPRP